MECWYINCCHSSFKNECTFRVMPANECIRKIWMRYACITHVRPHKTPVICSCHFNEFSSYPISYLETKRKIQQSRDNSEPEDKKIKLISETLSDDEFDQSRFHENNFERDQSECTWYDFEPGANDPENDVNNIDLTMLEVELPKPSKENNNFAVQVDEADVVNFEQISESLDIFENMQYETENGASETMSKEIQDLASRIESLLCINENLRIENVELTTKLIEVSSLSALHEQQKIENDQLHVKIVALESCLAQIDYSFDFSFIENSDKKVFAYTGLPNKDIFNIVLNVMTKFEFTYVCGWTPTKISKKNQFLMTLMKLRMDLRNFDLAERFKCSVATVSNIVRSWILAMHEILFLQLMKDIPSRNQNKNCLPIVFKEFPNCRIVLDCTEMFTDKPDKMFQQKSVYSPYKHHVTFKPLLGVAPNGVITYASRFYPGSTSDKKIVEHCGITHKLCIGDCVLADKGFLVKDVLPYGVHLNVPPFLTTLQFTRVQVRHTETIARARVHVERAINKVKNFRILKYIPSEMFFIASEVFQVCVALTNFQNPVIQEIATKL